MIGVVLEMFKSIGWVVVSNISYVHPENWEMIHFDEHIFQMGWNHQQNVHQKFERDQIPTDR